MIIGLQRTRLPEVLQGCAVLPRSGLDYGRHVYDGRTLS